MHIYCIVCEYLRKGLPFVSLIGGFALLRMIMQAKYTHTHTIRIEFRTKIFLRFAFDTFAFELYHFNENSQSNGKEYLTRLR